MSDRTHRVWRIFLGGPLSIALAGCPQYAQDPSPSPTPPTKTQNNTTEPANNQPLSGGELRYAQLCASCHGEQAQGGIGPKLTDWSGGRAALIEVIDATMPTQDPTQCQRDCAEEIADLLLAGLPQTSCDPAASALPPRRLRLLSRAEYTQTIRDIFAPYLGQQQASQLCATLSDCQDPGSQTCTLGQCQARPCELKLFAFDAQGRQLNSVHVSGSFNGWPTQHTRGGLAMSYDTSRGLWLAEAKLPDGAHAYKFVLNDQEWIPDPTNPARVDDTFGGFNSVLNVSCEAGDPTLSTLDAAINQPDWAEAIPLAQRPHGFDYDHSVETLFVSGLHLEAYLHNAEQLSQLIATHSDKLAAGGCELSQRACLESTVSSFGSRTFRRPLSPQELESYLTLASSDAPPAEQLATITRAMLSSPNMLYRFELGQDQGDGRWALDDFELASALSYLYWGTMPDDELMRAARAGELKDDDKRLAQAKRLLEDPRADQTIGRFVEQWLGIDKLRTKTKNPNQYPEFTPALREAMLQETRTFFTQLARDPSAGLNELFSADYSWLNAALAQHYGQPVQAAQGWWRAQDTTGQRSAGLLTHASVLATFAHSDQTSPVLRGLLVRQRLLCQEFPPPPANAGGVPEVRTDATTRERFSQHSADPACAGCHQLIDPIGFGFEHYDPIGRWRTTDQGATIDANASIKDLERFGQGTQDDFTDLGQLGALLAKSQRARDCMVQQRFRFTYGYIERAAEQCTLTALSRALDTQGFTINALLLALPQHVSFTHRQ